MLSLAALTAAAQLDDDAPSGYVASYSEGEHTVQSELFYLPPSHSVEKRLREMASEVDRPTETDAIASAAGSSASNGLQRQRSRPVDARARARIQPRVAPAMRTHSPGGTACHLLRASPCGFAASLD